jgi:hypothetical protein
MLIAAVALATSPSIRSAESRDDRWTSLENDRERRIRNAMAGAHSKRQPNSVVLHRSAPHLVCIGCGSEQPRAIVARTRN